MEKPKRLLEQEIDLCKFPECNSFGKSKKSPVQNAGCFLSAAIGYLKAPANKRVSELKKFSKYLSRVGEYASDECNDVVRHDLSENKLVAIAFYKIISNIEQFDFECRKKIIQHFEEFCSCRGWSGISYILNSFAFEGDIAAITQKLIKLGVENELVLGCAAKVLRIFAANPETFWVFLDWKVFEKVFRLAGERNLLIASQFATILEVESNLTKLLIFSKNKKISKTVAGFILDAYHHLFAIIRSSECMLFQRNMIDLMYRLMLEPNHSKFLKVFLNDPNQLKETMVGLTCKPSCIEFENSVLMSLYISNYDQISNLRVKKIILQNKVNLKKALENTHPEIFDIRHECKFTIEELEKMIDEMPEAPITVSQDSGCSHISCADSSDKLSSKHPDSHNTRSRRDSLNDSDKNAEHL